MILQALADFDRRQRATPGEEPAPEGFTKEKISFGIVLDEEGEIISVSDLRVPEDKKLVPTAMPVPSSFSRPGTKAQAFFLWDKTEYALGLTANMSERTDDRHLAFRKLHQDELYRADDLHIRAFLRFLDSWTTAKALTLSQEYPDIVDSNVIFGFGKAVGWLHDQPAARDAWMGLRAKRSGERNVCLVTGDIGGIARLHPPIKGVWGGQTQGAPLISFDKDSTAYASYGKLQGDNAPVSQSAAEAYGRALNELLSKGSRRRVQIGDASTVFWAERDAPEADSFMAQLFGGIVEEAGSSEPQLDGAGTAKVRDGLQKLEKGRPFQETGLAQLAGLRFFVLGLSPNAARLSVRFWHTDTLGVLAEHFGQHWRDLMIEPVPWKQPPALWRLLIETAVERKSENVPHQLAGELTRAILTGGQYPHSLLATVVVRIRADGEVNGMRAALCKACLVRDARINSKQEDRYLSLDLENKDPAYRLGRLFALLENIQREALGKDINATIRDKYYGAASATPAGVFPLLLRGSNNHLANIRKDGDRGPGLALWLERRIGEILSAFGDHFPKSFSLEDQGRFTIGYYHERFTRSPKADGNDNSVPTED